MKLSAAPGHESRAGGSRLRQNRKGHRANGTSVMCLKKCLYSTSRDGARKAEGRLARREAPLLKKGGWAGLITAGLWEHGGGGINHLSPSPKSRGSSKPMARAKGRWQEARWSFSALPDPLASARTGTCQGCFPEDRWEKPTQFPGVPGKFSGSAVESDKSSALHEIPQGLKSLPCPMQTGWNT